MKTKLRMVLSALALILLTMPAGVRAQQPETSQVARRVIVFVWDGLRADNLTPEIAPNYFRIARAGVGVVEAVRNAYRGKLTLVPTMLQARMPKS
jgi:hypothetical protein